MGLSFIQKFQENFMQYATGVVSKFAESLESCKFIRRIDLSPIIRLNIAFAAVMAKRNGTWGTITRLSDTYAISRTFVYILADMLERTSEIIFGYKTHDEPADDFKAICSYMLSLRMEGRCSIDSSSTIMERFGKSPSASGSISRYLKYFGSVVPDTLCSVDNEIKMAVFASDEIFSGQKPILITVDPISSAILRIELSDSRKAEVWRNHWENIESNGYKAVYVVCDEASGLCSARKEALPDVVRQIDTYHAIAHRLGQWVNRLEVAAYSAIEAEYHCYRNLDSARSEQVIEKRIREFESAEKKAIEKIELYETFTFLYHCLIGELRIFNSKGELRDRKTSEENIEIALDLVESLGNEKLKEAAKKVRRSLPDLLNYFDVACEVLDKLQTSDIDNNALQALCLAWQWNKGVQKSKTPERRRNCIGNEQFYLEYASGYLQEGYEDIQKHVYKKLDHIIQSSAMVECINSIIRPYLNNSKNHITQETLSLIMFYHNHRRYKDGKRKGMTPMEILTGKKQEKDWIELLFELIAKKDSSFFSPRR